MTRDELTRQRIRTSLDESLIVEAAAGTGKTTELVSRIVNTLKAGKTSVNRIAAVTFTRKAAGELRLRLRIELDAMRSATKNAEELQFLEDALARLEEAHIGTIHAFCAELLRQRPVEARIAPGFEELDENQSARLYARAFNAWIQDALQRMPEGVRRALSRVAAGNSTDNDSPLDQIKSAGWALVQWRDFPRAWRSGEFNQREHVERILPEIAEAARMTATCTLAGHPLRKHLRCVTDFVSRMTRAEEIRPRDYDELEALLIQLARALWRQHQKGRGDKFSPQFSRAEMIAAMERLQATLDEFQRDSEADLAALLQAELRGLVERYEQLKARSGKLDFADLLMCSRNLIRDNAAVRRFMQDQFTHIFVDEFQDTDPIQVELLVLLAADDPAQTDWRAVRPVPGKLFLVGDPKQSIYRFRRADIITYQELCRLLQDKGVAIEYLSRSFRAVKPIQDAVNAAFAPEMTGDSATGQPEYVPLENTVLGTEQPAIVVLPAPTPYGSQRINKEAIAACLPDAVAAFVDWLIKESHWTVREPGTDELVPIASRHIAILFRRFMSWGKDVTRDYVHALEARSIPHLLWGARSFHQREEIETVRAALNAVEWPDDELSVYATLRGGLFAISDNLLLRYRNRVGSFHPFHAIPADIEPDYAPVTEALNVFGDLHRHRNRRSIVETVNALLEAPRAHAAFALRPSGNQVLANVYRICDLARTYEAGDGYSFRGFVDQLNTQSEREDSAEAPVLEEGTEGVRIMTVHSAKGLEFPIVVLGDMTANISSRHPDKHVNVPERLCAVRLLGCAPWELMDHEQEEHARDAAEGVRIAYVAATRARDLLVVTAVGDVQRDGWISPLNKAIYPPKSQFRASEPAPLCPAFGESTVLRRPSDYDGDSEFSVKPGLHTSENGTHHVVWWDPSKLGLRVEGSFGLRQEEILADDQDGHAAESVQLYKDWKTSRRLSVTRGGTASLNVFLATDGVEPPTGCADRVLVERVQRDGPRPKGARFGSLVHLVLRDVEFASPFDVIVRLARTHARLLNATGEEIEAAAQAVSAALRHPLLERARKAKRCHRELPIVIQDEILGVLDAVVDLAFLEDTAWTVVDFKTDAEEAQRTGKYRRQVGWYIHGLEKTTGAPARGYLLHV
ncbi:MAG TPA: UvrD-helicase domain-containing protein [Terriglobia bacterium]|jgi:ATP-dependent exoDNAse (exonuclease V) beta subunit